MIRRRVPLIWLLSGFLVCAPLSQAAEQNAVSLEPGMVNPGYHEKPAWFKNSFLDIREDVAEAAADGKRVVLYFYQDGCPYCKKLLDTNFALREIEDKTRAGFDVIAINIWGDREVTDVQGEQVTEKQFAGGLRVMYTPTMLFLNESGEVVLRVNGYYPPHRFTAALDYVASRAEAELAFRDYAQQQTPAAAQGKLHQDAAYLQEPYRLDRRAGGRPLAVFFEQHDCAACDELHLDILKREDSKAQLDRFDVALLDMWGKTPLTTPQGKAATAAEWARELNIQYAPTLVLFDAEGKEVFRAEAYLRSFHVQSVLDYVASGAYREQPHFQRFVQARAAELEAQGIHVDLMD